MLKLQSFITTNKIYKWFYCFFSAIIMPGNESSRYDVGRLPSSCRHKRTLEHLKSHPGIEAVPGYWKK